MKQQSLFAQRIKQQKQQVNANTGFPSTFKVEQPLTQEDKAKSLGIGLQEYQKIEQENLEMLKEMKPEQIKEMQDQLRATLSDQLISMFENGSIHKKQQNDDIKKDVLQNIQLNPQEFQNIVDNDFISITSLQGMMQSSDLASVKIALSMIPTLLKLQNVVHLEEIRLSEYLIDLIKSTNISISYSAYDVLYQYWNVIVPDCWNKIYSTPCGDVLDLYQDLERATRNKEFDNLIDLFRIRNILCKQNFEYKIEESLDIRYMIMKNDFKNINQLKIVDGDLFLFQRLIEQREYLNQEQFNILLNKVSKLDDCYLKQFIFEQYSKTFLCQLQCNKVERNPSFGLQELQAYEIIPFQSMLIDKNMDDLEYLIYEIKFQSKSIINKKLRKLCKWRIFNVIRTVYQNELKNTQKYQVLRNQLKIVLVEKEKEIYSESELIQSFLKFMKYEEGYQLYTQHPNEHQTCHPEFFMLKLFRLQLTQQVDISYFLYLFNQLDLNKLIKVANKNVSYFEKLLQKATFDSYFDPCIINTLFMFMIPKFNKDFHRILFEEFENKQMIEKVDLNIFKMYMTEFEDAYYGKQRFFSLFDKQK